MGTGEGRGGGLHLDNAHIPQYLELLSQDDMCTGIHVPVAL